MTGSDRCRSDPSGKAALTGGLSFRCNPAGNHARATSDQHGAFGATRRPSFRNTGSRRRIRPSFAYPKGHEHFETAP